MAYYLYQYVQTFSGSRASSELGISIFGRGRFSNYLKFPRVIPYDRILLRHPLLVHPHALHHHQSKRESLQHEAEDDQRVMYTMIDVFWICARRDQLWLETYGTCRDQVNTRYPDRCLHNPADEKDDGCY